MATRYFKFSFKQGSTNELVKMIRNYNEIYTGVTEQLKRVNSKELKTIYTDVLMDNLSKFKVRFGKRMDPILRKFRVLNNSKGKDNRSYTITHDFLEGNDKTFSYKSSSIKGSDLLNLLNSGRRNYVIPRTSNTTAKSPLIWYYGKRPKGERRWNWKKKRRRIHVMQKKSDIYKFGTNMFSYAAMAIEQYIDEIRVEIRKRMKGS